MGIVPVIRDYRLCTAEIFYHLPDHPHVLQTYVWQDYDSAPDFPRLKKFLRFWEHNIEGRLHSVTVASVSLAQTTRTRHAQAVLTLQ